MISVGLLEDAAAEIDATLDLLRPAIEDDGVRAVLVCEPSCLSAITDDWLLLRKLRTPLDVRRKLAAKAMLVEDFVDRYWDEHPVRPVVRGDAVRGGLSASGRAVFHGHCHQKALYGGGSSVGLLRRIFGERGVESVDTTCCGMAGSFGYDAGKYDLSMTIGELGVLPAARRAASGGDVMVACGTSCRHQIADGAGVRAEHAVVVAERVIFGG